MTKLYELPAHANPRPKIYGLSPDGHQDGYVEFDHIDGMYSLCYAYTKDGSSLGICHLKAWTELTPFEDGYRIVTSIGPKDQRTHHDSQ